MRQRARGGAIESWPADMTAPPDFDGPLYMDAVLTPNRSLSGPAFAIMMSVLGVASFCSGAVFVLMGAWPVMGFFGLDVFLVWLAFRLSYRSGRLREEVRVGGAGMQILRVHPGGHVQRWRAAPMLARVEVDRPMRHEGQVRLVSAGRVLVLGAFLSPPERAAFGARLKEAMERARDERWPVPG